MKLLFVIDEAYPLYKIGGLGDVGGSLPKALHTLGVDINLALPFHPEVKLDQTDIVASLEITYNQQQLPLTIHQTTLAPTSIPVYLVKEDRYLSQHTDASDNHADKFAVFSLAISTWLNQSPLKPDLLHLHDWHTALIPVILRHQFHSSLKSILTIHNLAYQGNTNTPVLDHLHLSPQHCQALSWDLQDHYLNILLEGLFHSDFITTVSPTYAREILTPEYGQQLDQHLQLLQGKIQGILNGIDLETFNPQTDPHIFTPYSIDNFTSGKTKNQAQLIRQLNLPPQSSLLIGFIGRVDPQQKGIQLIIEALRSRHFPPPNTNFVFLGTGDPELESQLHQVAAAQPHLSINTRYDEALAAKIYAGSDLILIPSKFEPCGLVQMIAMRYGALPVARHTGGLADTIDHLQNGFLFDAFNSQAMIDAVNLAVDTISHQNQKSTLITRAMKQDFSWDKPAQEYLALYQRVLAQPAFSESDLKLPLS